MVDQDSSGRRTTIERREQSRLRKRQPCFRSNDPPDWSLQNPTSLWISCPAVTYLMKNCIEPSVTNFRYRNGFSARGERSVNQCCRTERCLSAGAAWSANRCRGTERCLSAGAARSANRCRGTVRPLFAGAARSVGERTRRCPCRHRLVCLISAHSVTRTTAVR